MPLDDWPLPPVAFPSEDLSKCTAIFPGSSLALLGDTQLRGSVLKQLSLLWTQESSVTQTCPVPQSESQNFQLGPSTPFLPPLSA